jgi:hypothetical protein
MPFARTYISLTSTLSLLALLSTQAFADEKSNFNKVVEDPSEQQLVLTAAQQCPVVLQNPCASAKFAHVNQFSFYKPLEFDSSGNITAGAWKQTVSETGCGKERLLRVLVFINHQSKVLKAFPLYPGSTRADPLLQQDAFKFAAIAATSPQERDCKTIYVADTEFLRVTGEALEGAKGKPWDELWTLAICGKKAQVTMHFIPDKTGTTINTSPQETKFLPGDSK